MKPAVKVWYACAAICGIAYIWWVTVQQPLSIKTIDCQTTAQQPCSPEIIEKIKTVIAGKSLLFTDLPTRIQLALVDQPQIQLQSFDKQLPSKVRLRIQQQTVVYQLGNDHQELASIIANGQVVPAESTLATLTCLIDNQTFAEVVHTQQVGQELHRACLLLARYFEQSAAQSREVTITPDAITLESEGLSIKLPHSNLETALALVEPTMRWVHDHATEYPKVIAIDLRFKSPVITIAE